MTATSSTATTPNADDSDERQRIITQLTALANLAGYYATPLGPSNKQESHPPAMPQHTPGPDLSASPLEDCPCGAGFRVRQARKPDLPCDQCFSPCAARKWIAAALNGRGGHLCHACHQQARLDRQTRRAPHF